MSKYIVFLFVAAFTIATIGCDPSSDPHDFSTFDDVEIGTAEQGLFFPPTWPPTLPTQDFFIDIDFELPPECTTDTDCTGNDFCADVDGVMKCVELCEIYPSPFGDYSCTCSEGCCRDDLAYDDPFLVTINGFRLGGCVGDEPTSGLCASPDQRYCE